MNPNDTVAHLMAPLSADAPAGEDLDFDPLFDEIREERRSDDPSLAQGEWAFTLKSANWRRVKQLCEDTLTRRSKDLHIVAFHCEAITRLYGLDGAITGLKMADTWLRDFWETGFPALTDGDLDERAGKIEWFSNQLSESLRHVPLIPPERGGFHWYHWKESRETDNLKLRNADHFDTALAEGKLSGEVFDKSAHACGAAWFGELKTKLATATECYRALDANIDARFGQQAPSLANIRVTLQELTEVVTRLWQDCGGQAVPDAQAEVPTATHEVAPAHDTPSTPSTPSAPVTRTGAPGTPAAKSGPIESRAHAVALLNEVARYFRTHEPHSPVAPLTERAARWAAMGVEEWLRHVIKDEDALRRVQDLLDTQQG